MIKSEIGCSSSGKPRPGGGSSASGGAAGKMGSRRIFTPQFKLQVLDSYRNDSDCKGNQAVLAVVLEQVQCCRWRASLRSAAWLVPAGGGQAALAMRDEIDHQRRSAIVVAVRFVAALPSPACRRRSVRDRARYCRSSQYRIARRACRRAWPAAGGAGGVAQLLAVLLAPSGGGGLAADRVVRDQHLACRWVSSWLHLLDPFFLLGAIVAVDLRHHRQFAVASGTANCLLRRPPPDSLLVGDLAAVQVEQGAPADLLLGFQFGEDSSAELVPIRSGSTVLLDEGEQGGGIPNPFAAEELRGSRVGLVPASWAAVLKWLGTIQFTLLRDMI
ncbi:hypothetical protein pipiens_016505 [Culex pipiens pipiens]|uniref:Brinker DNA-binding domain-containing protein n=1 Tax=Culex pipiens pipiens TaxID=38569 RepID=A0ABD1CLB7_CULPP